MIWRPSLREPPELDAHMTASDLVDELQRLRFDRHQFNAIKIDEPVRDYLVASLARHVTHREHFRFADGAASSTL